MILCSGRVPCVIILVLATARLQAEDEPELESHVSSTRDEPELDVSFKMEQQIETDLVNKAGDGGERTKRQLCVEAGITRCWATAGMSEAGCCRFYNHDHDAYKACSECIDTMCQQSCDSGIVDKENHLCQRCHERTNPTPMSPLACEMTGARACFRDAGGEVLSCCGKHLGKHIKFKQCIGCIRSLCDEKCGREMAVTDIGLCQRCQAARNEPGKKPTTKYERNPEFVRNPYAGVLPYIVAKPEEPEEDKEEEKGLAVEELDKEFAEEGIPKAFRFDRMKNEKRKAVRKAQREAALDAELEAKQRKFDEEEMEAEARQRGAGQAQTEMRTVIGS